MRCRRAHATLALCVVAALVSACTQGPDGTAVLQPLVFPWEGSLGSGGAGSTLAVVIDSNYIDGNDDLELYDLERSDITVDVVDPDGIWTGAPATVRSVFPLHAAPSSRLAVSEPGAWMTVVVLDLPDEAGFVGIPAYPFTALLQVSVNGIPDLEPRIRVLGNGGAPNPIVDPSLLSGRSLESRPMLRLRPKRLAGGFEPGQPMIGGIEFRAFYPDICATNIAVFPGSEAANASVAVGSPSAVGPLGYRERRVALVSPAGFGLRYLSAPGTDETLAGEGPLIDIAVNWKATTDESCDLAEPLLLVIQDLVVTDIDGNQIFSVPGVVEVDRVAAPTTTSVFRGYPVDIPPPPPSGGC